ncbi:hypothetical protein K280104A7_17240 [Candidatus Bariatricus faecipullorum]
MSKEAAESRSKHVSATLRMARAERKEPAAAREWRVLNGKLVMTERRDSR